MSALCSGPIKLSDVSRQRPALQANVWTEYIGDEHTLEYMLLPRLCALSEALWSPKPTRDWQGFQHRLRPHLRHLDAMGMRYRPLG